MTHERREGWDEERWNSRPAESGPSDDLGRIDMGDAKSDCRGQPNRAEETEATGASKTGSRPRVLARLPNLDVAELDKIVESGPVPPKASRLRQRVSTAVLIGVGLLFFVVAVLPFRGSSEWKLESPAPEAPVAPSWNSSASQTPETADPASKIPLEPQIPSLQDVIPDLPSSIPSVPAAIQGPSGGSNGNTPATQSQSTPLPWNGQSQRIPQPGMQTSQATTSGLAPAGFTTVTSSVPAAMPASRANHAPSTSNSVSYPTTPYVGGFDTPSAAVTPVPAVNPSAVNRPVVFNGQPNWSGQSPTRVTSATGNAYVYPPQANTAAGGTAATTQPAVAEPGVARLQGVIEKSTSRINYDSPRSSLY